MNLITLSNGYSLDQVESMLHTGMIDQITYEAYVLLWTISAFHYDDQYAKFHWQQSDMSVVSEAWESIRVGRYNGQDCPRQVSIDYSRYTFYTLHCYKPTGKSHFWFNGKSYAL
jgi:hypothetical protein